MIRKTRKINRVATRKRKNAVERARATRTAGRKRRKQFDYSERGLAEGSSTSADSDDEPEDAKNGAVDLPERRTRAKRVKVETRGSEDEDPTFDPSVGDEMIHSDFLYPDVKVEAKEDGEREERDFGGTGAGGQKSAKQGG